MSTRPTTSKGESKLPPAMDSIVTRRKAAQLKRQLRNKDSSIKRISQFTQLLLSTTKSHASKSPPIKSKSNVSKNILMARTKNVKEGPEKKDVIQSPMKRDRKGKFVKKKQSLVRNVDKVPEYYPNKLKRNFEGKKVVLKPKHEMKVVVGTRIGKRKLVLPQKGADTGLPSPPPKLQKLKPSPKSPKPKPVCTELSIVDLVHLHNDDLLDDEDWLEILTCPSPVWWEDPPDPGFDDKSMLQLPVTKVTPEISQTVRKRNKTRPMKAKLESQVNITEGLSESNVKVLEMKKADDKFMRKRSKLESLLGNIRNKINDCIESGYKSDKLNMKCESDVGIKKTAVSLDNIEIDNQSNSPVSRKEKRTSESTEEDPFSNFRDDDLLNDLENIEIPMKSNEQDKCEDKNAESFLNTSSNVDKCENYGQQKTNAEKFSDCNSLQDKSDPNQESHSVATFQSPSREENNEISHMNPQISKLTTTSIEKDVSTSPMSAKSVISMSDETYETSSVKSQDADTISDTNIKFIDEDEASNSKACEIAEKEDRIDNALALISNQITKISNINNTDKDVQSKQSCNTKNVTKSSNMQNPRKEKDSMTVYKIISNENDSDNVNSADKDEQSQQLCNAQHITKFDNNNIPIPRNEKDSMTVYKIISKEKDSENLNSADKDQMSQLLSNTENITKSGNNNIPIPRKEKDCMTVYKIISNEKDSSKVNNKDNKNNTMMSKINELIKASKEYNNFKANLQSSEASKTKLDSFFKKYKSHYQPRQIKRPETAHNNSIDTLDNDNLNVKNNDKNQGYPTNNTNESIEIGNENEKEIQNTQNKSEDNLNDDEKSIIVPNSSSSAIKYCLKCSCIFDTNNCDYCVEKAKTSSENHISSCKNSSNREKSIEVDSFLCDLCKTKNND